MKPISQIKIVFPVGIQFPAGFERALDGLVSMICDAYVAENPGRTMWTSGFGSEPIWNEPHEPDFDNSVYMIEISEQEKREPVHEFVDYYDRVVWMDECAALRYDLYIRDVNCMIAMRGNSRMGRWNGKTGQLKKVKTDG